MAVRLSVRLCANPGGSETRAVAVANSGYEAERPEVLLPADVARRLGLYPDLPLGARVVHYGTAGGEASFVRIADAVDVTVEAEGRASAPVRAAALVSEGEAEALLNDACLQALGIVLLAPRDGLWCFTDDPAGTRRPSAALF